MAPALAPAPAFALPRVARPPIPDRVGITHAEVPHSVPLHVSITISISGPGSGSRPAMDPICTPQPSTSHQERSGLPEPSLPFHSIPFQSMSLARAPPPALARPPAPGLAPGPEWGPTPSHLRCPPCGAIRMHMALPMCALLPCVAAALKVVAALHGRVALLWRWQRYSSATFVALCSATKSVARVALLQHCCVTAQCSGSEPWG
jgi:hypothetical protein